MTEFADPGDTTSAQIAAESLAFDALYINAFDVRRRLGLETGYHKFDIDHPRYSRVDLGANAYDDTYVTLYSRPEEMGISVRGIPYTLERWRSISRRANGGFSYYGYDSMIYRSRWDEEQNNDSELDTDGSEHDFSEPLPPEISDLIADINDVLPTLTIDQHNDEESETWFDPDRYDRAKKKELQELELALSSAGGALFLLQLAVIDRRRKLNQGGVLNEDEFKVPKGNSVFDISAWFDAGPGAVNWHPHIIEAKKGSMGAYFHTYQSKFEHITSHILVEDADRFVQYEVSDTLERDGSSITIDTARTQFAPADLLPDGVLSLVKHLLKAITSTDFSLPPN